MSLSKAVLAGAALCAGLMAQDLRIIRAQYGHDSRWMDVTETLRRNVRGGRLDVVIGNPLFGIDPAPAELKSLRVEYVLNGQRFNEEFRENVRLMLPAVGGRDMDRDRDRDRDDRRVDRGMGAEFMILSAQYGARDRWVDVTRIVRGYVRDGQLRMRVSNETLGGDPARGADKWLRIEYSLNGVRDRAESPEGSDVVLGLGGYREPAPPPPPPVFAGGRLIVISAQYGIRDRWVDVTRIVRGFVRDGQLRMRVNNDTMGGDPYRGPDKILRVEYEVDGRRMRREIREGDDMVLP